MSECGCEIHEEVHYELPDQPVEYVLLSSCPRHEYDARGLQIDSESTISAQEDS
jgi:hypothetical protein